MYAFSMEFVATGGRVKILYDAIKQQEDGLLFKENKKGSVRKEVFFAE